MSRPNEKFFKFIQYFSQLQVANPFVVSQSLGFVPLPEKHEEVEEGSDAVVSGWGRLWVNVI